MHALLPDILQDVEVWMSAHDIDAGAKWNVTLSSELEASSFGILCLTQENLASPWLLFEAGSISKSVSGAHVVPYLLGLGATDVTYPLAQFQGVEATADGTMRLLRAINSARPEPMTDERLRRLFDRWWPDLQAALHAVPAVTSPSAPRRDDRSILEEILQLIRGGTSRPERPSIALDATPSSMVWKTVHDVTEADLQVMSLRGVLAYLEAVHKRYITTASSGEENALDNKEMLVMAELQKRGFVDVKAARQAVDAASVT